MRTIGLLVGLVVICAFVASGAFAADYYIVKKDSGQYEIMAGKPEGDAKMVEGPFASKEKARQRLDRMTKEHGKQTEEKDRPEHAKATDEMRALRSSTIVGLDVENRKGESLGSIDELVIAGEGKVVYVILAHGGFLGIGDKLLPIPWDTLKYDPEDKVAVIEIAKKSLEQAPSFGSDEWPNLDEPGWRDKLEGYYRDAKNRKVSGDRERTSSR